MDDQNIKDPLNQSLSDLVSDVDESPEIDESSANAEIVSNPSMESVSEEESLDAAQDQDDKMSGSDIESPGHLPELEQDEISTPDFGSQEFDLDEISTPDFGSQDIPSPTVTEVIPANKGRIIGALEQSDLTDEDDAMTTDKMRSNIETNKQNIEENKKEIDKINDTIKIMLQGTTNNLVHTQSITNTIISSSKITQSVKEGLLLTLDTLTASVASTYFTLLIAGGLHVATSVALWGIPAAVGLTYAASTIFYKEIAPKILDLGIQAGKYTQEQYNKMHSEIPGKLKELKDPNAAGKLAVELRPDTEESEEQTPTSLFDVSMPIHSEHIQNVEEKGMSKEPVWPKEDLAEVIRRLKNKDKKKNKARTASIFGYGSKKKKKNDKKKKKTKRKKDKSKRKSGGGNYKYSQKTNLKSHKRKNLNKKTKRKYNK